MDFHGIHRFPWISWNSMDFMKNSMESSPPNTPWIPPRFGGLRAFGPGPETTYPWPSGLRVLPPRGWALGPDSCFSRHRRKGEGVLGHSDPIRAGTSLGTQSRSTLEVMCEFRIACTSSTSNYNMLQTYSSCLYYLLGGRQRQTT